RGRLLCGVAAHACCLRPCAAGAGTAHLPCVAAGGPAGGGNSSGFGRERRSQGPRRAAAVARTRGMARPGAPAGARIGAVRGPQAVAGRAPGVGNHRRPRHGGGGNSSNGSWRTFRRRRRYLFRLPARGVAALWRAHAYDGGVGGACCAPLPGAACSARLARNRWPARQSGSDSNGARALRGA
ncbi:unnamed protein product, partial [Phaeothamnion confervicola]